MFWAKPTTRNPPNNRRLSPCRASPVGPFGVFPDCEGLGASVFLNLVYGYALLTAAGFISDGSELLLEILSPGLVGGLLLPILGAVPDAAVIIASGLGASKEDAQEQVSVGMGTLAGSTVMLLTIAWGGSLWVGRRDLDESRGRAINKTLSQRRPSPRPRTATGVTTDRDTKLNAKIMMASCLLFLIVQVPALMGDAGRKRRPRRGRCARSSRSRFTAASRCCTPSFSGGRSPRRGQDRKEARHYARAPHRQQRGWHSRGRRGQRPPRWIRCSSSLTPTGTARLTRRS